MNRLYVRILHGLSLLAFAVTATACGGGSAGAPPLAPTGASAGATASRSFDGTVSYQTRPSAVQRYERDRDNDLTLVSILQMNVANGNASFSPYGWWDCLNIGLDTANRRGDSGDDWPVYAPRSTQSFDVPAFDFKNPCSSGWGDDDHSSGRNFYVVMLSLTDFTSTVVAGPGAVASGKVDFPAANAPFTMQSAGIYVFFLVSSKGVLATPTPSATPTPAATPTPTPVACPNYAGGGGAPLFGKGVPAPVMTAAPAGLFGFAAQSVPLMGGAACNPASKQIDALSPTGGYLAYTPGGSGTVEPLGSGSQVIAAFANGNVLLSVSGKSSALTLSSLAGSLLSTIPVGSATYVQAVTASDGNAYVAVNAASPEIVQVTPSGAQTTFSAPAACTQFAALAADNAGNVYASDASCGIVEMNASGTFTTVLGAIPNGDLATTLAVGPDGALYYGTSSGSIARVSGGTVTTVALPAAANNVLAIVAGPNDRLWFSADAMSAGVESGGAIGEWNFATGAITLYPTSVTGVNDPAQASTAPTALVAGPSGKLYGPTESAQNTIVTIDPSKG
jgi:hypothetical protein